MAHKNKTNFSPYKSSCKSRHPSKQGKPGKSGKHRKPDEIFSPEEANDRFYDIFRNHDFSEVSHFQRSQFSKFYWLLMKAQEKDNFTRLLKLRDIAIKHFIDCMMVPRLVKLEFPLLDLGSGPGFPGIPLKIIFPNEKIILAEGVQRRVDFLKKVREELSLNQLDIVGRNINLFFAYPVRGVITRAVEDIRNTLTNVSSCLQTGGCVYFMKGPGVDAELEIAKKEMGEFYQQEMDKAYVLPNTEHKRRLVVFRKIKMNPLVDFDEEPWPEEK